MTPLSVYHNIAFPCYEDEFELVASRNVSTQARFDTLQHAASSNSLGMSQRVESCSNHKCDIFALAVPRYQDNEYTPSGGRTVDRQNPLPNDDIQPVSPIGSCPDVLIEDNYRQTDEPGDKTL